MILRFMRKSPGRSRTCGSPPPSADPRIPEPDGGTCLGVRNSLGLRPGLPPRSRGSRRSSGPGLQGVCHITKYGELAWGPSKSWFEPGDTDAHGTGSRGLVRASAPRLAVDLGACLRRTRSWPVPPRWTPRDWREELDAEGIAAACTAIRNFDPTRGPTLGSFVYHQILSGALARYRQEWSYALRCRPGLEARGTLSLRRGAVGGRRRQRTTAVTMGACWRTTGDLIQRLFWDGWTESQVAGSLGISQQAVSKRKQKILHELRRRFARNGEV